jgi:hypothetical protein
LNALDRLLHHIVHDLLGGLDIVDQRRDRSHEPRTLSDRELARARSRLLDVMFEGDDALGRKFYDLLSAILLPAEV